MHPSMPYILQVNEWLWLLLIWELLRLLYKHLSLGTKCIVGSILLTMYPSKIKSNIDTKLAQ